MTIYNLDFVKELVNAFNVSNYGSEVNTNFVVEGDNIVVKFNCDQSYARKYLSQMAEDLVKEYFSDKSVAGHFFDLKSFPFNFDKGRWTFNKAGTQFTVPICSGVIFNLKVHFAEEFRSEVRHQMIREVGGNSQHIKEILNKNIQQVAMGTSPHYIKCLWFNDPGVQAHFMKVLRAKMQKYSFNLLDFCRIDGNKVYFTDVENIDFVRSVTEVAKKRSGYHFCFPSSDDLKVRKYKGAMGEIIFSLTGIPIYGYYRDNFIDKDRISNGDHFAFIPISKEGNNLRYLTLMEADKINAKFSHDILTNIRGQTEATRSDVFGDVYALSDGQIALLIPVIIENSVINKEGQIEIDPGLYEKLQASPTKLDSPRYEPVVLPHMRHNVGAAEVVAAKNVQAGTSAWSQQTNPWLSQGTSGNKWQPLLQLPEPGPSGSSWTQSRPSSWKGANESTSIGNITWYVSLSGSPDLGILGDYPKGTESICGVEPEKKQQVTDKSVQGACGGSPKKQNKIRQFFRDLSIRRSKSNGTATKDILQFDKETFSSFSPGMQKVLSLPLSIDMIRNLCLHLPIARRKELITFACSEKVKNHTQVLRRLSDYSHLFFLRSGKYAHFFPPDKQNKIYVDLSPGAREQVVLFLEVLRGRGVSCDASTSPEESGSGSQQNLSMGGKLGNMLSKLSSSIQNLFTNPASPKHKGVPGGLNQHQKEEL